MERVSRGFRLLKASWQVLKSDRELMLLPIVSFLAIAVVAGIIFGAAAATGSFVKDQRFEAVDYVFIGIFYFVATFISVFFNAAVVGAATLRLQGGDPTIKDGIRMARSKTGKIVGWAALTATVGLILRSLEEKAGFLGDLVIGLIGAAWGAITFFVVPVLLFEPVGVVDSVKRSAHLFRERWGEQFTGNVSIGLALFLIALPVIGISVLLWMVLAPLGIAVAVLAIGLLIALGSALSGIFNAALYRFATTGEAAGAFTTRDLQGSFRPRRGRAF